VLRYRRRSDDDALPPQTHGNNLVEIIWTVIPTVIVAYMFVISMQTLGSVDAVSSSPDLKVRAVAGQFQWQFDYLAADGTTRLFTESAPLASNGGGMHLPVGRSVQVELTSPDVLHAFYVPEFLFKRDVVPGQVNRFDFTIDASEAGQTFRGQCAELCGIGHQAMQFDVVAVTQQEYDAWVAQKIAEANATPAPRPSGETLNEITAKDIAFDKHELTVTAGQPFAIRLQNQDPAGVPHDIDVRQSDGRTVLQDKPTVDGGKEVVYDYTALQAGSYVFICSVHPIPAMTGTLTVR
jgi:cytochrome c oxidase subunit 2